VDYTFSNFHEEVDSVSVTYNSHPFTFLSQVILYTIISK